MISQSGLSEAVTRCRGWLPRGNLLPDAAWNRRNRVIIFLLWALVPVVLGVAIVEGFSVAHGITDSTPVVLAAALALMLHRGRGVRSITAAIGLLSACAALVHLTGGLIEMHFLFFIMVGVITLYQDWLPFLVAIAFVALHHGIGGALDPHSVYNHADAWAHPWEWAGIHAAFILAMSVVSIVAWKLNEELHGAIRVSEAELRHQALHDALTDLPNRALITDRIEQLLARSRREGTTGAALYIDLDDFKNVNDRLGHEAGDRLLMAVAARFQSTLREADTIGRMGGDEFVVLIDGGRLQVAPELVAQRLLEVMRQPFELEGVAIPLGINASIGIAMGDRATGGDLLRDADVALYQAKAAGKNRYEMFHPEMQTEISRRIELEFDLRAALASDQFRLVYQPIYNLDDLTLVGVEALIRWEHPTRGVIQPDEFIPILEQTGQIREVGRWVLGAACEQMAAWHVRGATLDVSVNVSGRQLDSDAIINHVREALHVSGLNAASLIIEVTETALMRDARMTAQRLQAIKDLGVRIAVDDFGTGYSSLAYLQQFPVDCLKIDRTFTNAITTSPESKALIGTLVQLGKDLGLTTLAEGVETTGEMDHLRSEHVNQAQGFLMSRPLDAETLETQLLDPSRSLDPHG